VSEAVRRFDLEKIESNGRRRKQWPLYGRDLR
jgi:hypothetical protein